MHHWKYLKYVLRHKWFVFLACRKCRVSLWRSIIHDWHKFLPSEWFAYADYFYGEWNKLKESEPDDFRYWTVQGQKQSAFMVAWNFHQKRADHHWQFWLLTNDNDTPQTVPLEMPKQCWREMVADWWGAGRAITGKWDAQTWYYKQKDKIILSPKTRFYVEHLLNKTDSFEFNRSRQIAA